VKPLLIFIIVVGVVGVITYQMIGLAKVECELCIEFKSQKHCPTALGATHEEALDEAHRNACAILSSGVTEVLACQRQERQDVSCTPPIED